MERKYRIGIDAGTSALKAAIIDRDGKTVATGEQKLELLRQGVRVEMDAIKFRDALFGLLARVAAPYAQEIIGIAISGAAGSTLMLDGAGKPSEIISWLDERTIGNVPKCLSGISNMDLRRCTGWPCLDCFPLAHIAWWQANQGERIKAAS